jgi:hypothetical protein
MTIDLSNIFIFKTNIQTEFDKLRIKNVLDRPRSTQWNIDMDDADVLRSFQILCDRNKSYRTYDYVGFECSELEEVTFMKQEKQKAVPQAIRNLPYSLWPLRCLPWCLILWSRRRWEISWEIAI